MYRWLISLRYLLKRRIALFAISAVMLCVALLIVITSLFNGFVSSYLHYTDQVFGQIVFYPYRPMTDYESLLQAFESVPGVKRVQPVLRTGALLYFGRGNVKAVQVVGIDIERNCQDPAFRQALLLDREDLCTFQLNDDERRKSQQWLSRRLRRELRPDDYPVGAIIGVGLLAEPDEQTDRYDIPALREQIAQLQGGYALTTGYRGDGADPDSDSNAAEKRSGLCRPVNLIQTGLHEVDTMFVYLPLDYVATLAGTRQADNRYATRAEIQITADDTTTLQAILPQLQHCWKNYAQQNLHWPSAWADSSILMISANSAEVRQFTAAIKQQLFILQLILSLICLVVVTLVFVILLMVVYEKRRDVGILRSLGASRRGIAAIFLIYGFVVGLTGAVLGMALGALATRNIAALEQLLSQALGFKIWRSGVYMFADIPNQVAWHAVLWIMLVGIAAAVLGAVLPAIRAARLQPVQALRYE